MRDVRVFGSAVAIALCLVVAGAWIRWDAESVTPWRSVIWPTPSGEVAFGG